MATITLEVPDELASQLEQIADQLPEMLTEEANLALACTVCNGNKGSDFATVDPESQQLVRLFDPRCDIWSEHFALDGAVIVALTGVGRGTVEILKLNAPTRVKHRALLQSTHRYPIR